MNRTRCIEPLKPFPLCLPVALLLLIGTAFWPAPAPAGNNQPLKITVSIPPQAWFVQRIGVDRVQIQILLSPGHSPATYEPTFKQMTALHDADLFLAAGVPFERGLLPRLEAIPQGPRIRGPRPAGGGHGHHHGDLDPHTWLDPAQAAALADSICAALIDLQPSSADRFRTGLESVKNELAELRMEIGASLADYAGREFFVFHPAFGHFTRAFGLTQVAIEDDGHEPGARHLAEVIERAQAAGATAVIVQPQFSHKSAAAVAAAVGAKIQPLDPLAADYAANLRHIARTLAGILAPAGSDS